MAALCVVVQFDEMWANHPRFVKYDFHNPLDVSHTRQHGTASSQLPTS